MVLTQLPPKRGTIIFRLHGHGHHREPDSQRNSYGPNGNPHDRPYVWFTAQRAYGDLVPLASTNVGTKAAMNGQLRQLRDVRVPIAWIGSGQLRQPTEP